MKKLLIPFSLSGPVKVIAVIQLVIFIVLWQFIPSTTIPSPVAIAETWVNLIVEQGLLYELKVSVGTILQALLYSSVISIGIALISTATLFRPVSTAISTLRFLGFAGLTYLFTLWTSNAGDLKLWLLTFGMTVFLLTNFLAEIRAIPASEIDYARTLKMSGWRITYEIAFLGRIHVFLDLIRQNAAIGWTLLSMVEGLTRSEGGIGAMLINQNRYMHLSAVFAIQLTILAYGWLQDIGLQQVRKLACPYSELNKVKS